MNKDDKIEELERRLNSHIAITIGVLLALGIAAYCGLFVYSVENSFMKGRIPVTFGDNLFMALLSTSATLSVIFLVFVAWSILQEYD
jgi:hypothetical protein